MTTILCELFLPILQWSFYNFQHSVRYFHVIENICKIQAWDIIKSALTEDYNGSAVLTTTNSAHIAGYVGDGHKLKTLNARSLCASYSHLPIQDLVCCI